MLKSYYWGKVKYSKLRFYKFKKFVCRSVSGELQPTQILLNFKAFYRDLKIIGLEAKWEVWEQNYVSIFFYFYFANNFDVLKSKRLCFLLNKNINFKKKTRQNWKWNIPHTVLQRWRLCFSPYMNCKLKVKLWWVEARERNKGAFFATFILPEIIFIMYSVLNKLWEYIFFYISKNITSYPSVYHYPKDYGINITCDPPCLKT